jgi:spore coat polysaccharide biosynthesis protein SpsF
MIEREPIELRRVQEADAGFLWSLANDPEVRAASFSITGVSWENHLKWLRTRLNDPSCIFFIVTIKNNTPIGQVRFDKTCKEAVISISIKKEYRGKSLGAAIIGISTELIFKQTDIIRVHAYIKKGNNSSISAFLKANFKDCGIADIEGNESIHLMKENIKNDSFN